MNLRFGNRRRIEGVDYRDPVATARSWLNRDQLSPNDQAQILNNLLSLGEHKDLTEDDIWNGDHEFSDHHFDGLAETPIEGWDVVDASSSIVRFQLWIGWVDGGVLVESGTTNEVGDEGIVQGYWHGDPEFGEALQLARDKLRASRQLPDSLVLRICFRSEVDTTATTAETRNKRIRPTNPI